MLDYSMGALERKVDSLFRSRIKKISSGKRKGNIRVFYGHGIGSRGAVMA
jgi:hypothetical protein